MELILNRVNKNKYCTIGELYINGKFQCYTLEDVERKSKIKGKTAIPTGRYEVILNMSNRFKRVMPLLLNVPNFEGVRIHTGNSAKDTEGCILVGRSAYIDNNVIGESRIAWNKLMDILTNAKEKIFLTIK